jgi:hypothetical protein
MGFWMTLGERVKHDVSSALEPFLQQKQEIDKYKKQYRDLADPELCRRLQELRGKNQPERQAILLVLKDRHGEKWIEVAKRYGAI